MWFNLKMHILRWLLLYNVQNTECTIEFYNVLCMDPKHMSDEILCWAQDLGHMSDLMFVLSSRYGAHEWVDVVLSAISRAHELWNVCVEHKI